MWRSHEKRNGFLTSWQAERPAKINSCGIAGPAGPLEQEMIKRSHEGSLKGLHGDILVVCLQQVMKDVVFC